MKNDIRIASGRLMIEDKSGILTFFGINDVEFEQLKKIGRYAESKGHEWVTAHNITFHKAD